MAKIFLFEAFGVPGGLGLVDRAASATPSQALLSLARALSAIGGSARDVPAGSATRLRIVAYRNPAGRPLFAGGATPNLPPMTPADSLVFLPVQSAGNRIAVRSAVRIAVIYYVMTPDIRIPFGQEKFTVLLQCAGIPDAAIKSYDPVADIYSRVPARKAGVDLAELDLTANDTPRILILDFAA